jgi:hypothetical protein
MLVLAMEFSRDERAEDTTLSDEVLAETRHSRSLKTE